jgi:hypothetical protein
MLLGVEPERRSMSVADTLGGRRAPRVSAGVARRNRTF